MANELERRGAVGGGAGGKLRTSRSTRRVNTPYERPQTGRHAPAVVRAAAAAAAESSRRSDNSNGRSWLSRIVDPASRIISNGARRWFSSVFQKRLTAPPSSDAIAEIQEDTLKDVAEETVENAMVTEENDQEPILLENQSEPEAAGLDVLLKDKSLSRDEFNRLIELLETRVVDDPSGMPDYEVKTTEELKSGNAPVNVANTEAQRWRDERRKAREEKEKSVWDDSLLFNPSSPVAARTLRDDAGSSPADIAKAFMGGSHRTTISTSAMRCRPFGDQMTPNRLFRDEQAPNVSNVHQLVPRTESSLFGNGQADDRFKTPHNRLKSTQFVRSQNRVQGLSYTPYSRNQHRVHVEHMGDGSSTPATRWTPIQSPVAGGRQMLKRRSSVLDDGMMSVGPIRRTRHKSNFHTPLRNSDPSCSNGNQHSPSLLPGNDYGQNALTSFRNPMQIEKQNNVLSAVQPTEDATKDSSISLACVPQQSSETARKILEQLDRMVPSPKEKSAEAKLAIARAKSPTLLSVSMLNGHARRSTETIDSIPIFNMHGLDSSPLQENKQSRAQGASGSEQKYEGKGKSTLFNSVPTSWGASTSSDAGDVALQSLDVISSKVDKKLEVDSSVTIPEKIKGFRMSASEESDEEGHVNMNATVPPESVNATFTSHDNIMDSTTFKGDRAITSTSTIMTTKAEVHALTSAAYVVDQSSINNSSGFSFPVSPVASNFPEPPTPTPMPSPLKKANTQPMEETSAPTFNFGSENTSKGPVFSFPASGCTDVDITKPEFGFKFESKPEESFSTAVAAAAASSSAPPLPLQTTLGPLGTSALIFKGPSVSGLSGNSSSAPSSSTVFSSTNVATSSSNILLFGGALSQTDGTNDSLKCFANGDQSSDKSENEAEVGIFSSMPSLFGLTNAALSASSNASGASNSTSIPLSSTQVAIAGSLFGQASCSAPVTTSAPLLFGSSGGSSSPSAFVSSTSLFSTSLSVSVGGTSPLLFGSASSTSASSGSTGLFGQNTPNSVISGSFPSFGLGSSSFGTSISTPFGSTLASGSAIASTFGASGNLPSGSSGTAFSGSNVAFGASNNLSSGSGGTAFSGSNVTFVSGGTPQFGANTSSFGLITSSKFGSSTASLSGLNSSSHIGSNTSLSIESSSNQFGSSSSSSFGSGVAFSTNATTSFSSVPAFSFGSGSSAFSSASTFASGSSPSFIGSSSLFGSGSIPAFGGSSTSPTSSTPAFGASNASFGSANNSPFGGSSSLFGSASTPLFGLSSMPQFGVAQSFGASSSMSSSPSTTPSFGSGFGVTPVSASTGFSFGGSSIASSSSFAFGASGNTSPGTTFSFNSVSASPNTLTFGSKDTSMSSQPSNFGLANMSPMFGTTQSSTPTDQMEDSMAEDPAQVTPPVFGGQPASSFGGQPASSGPAFAFSSQPIAPLQGQNVFQFGAQPNSSTTGLEFSGGSFSLGAGSEKPGRRIIKAKRDKGRRK